MSFGPKFLPEVQPGWMIQRFGSISIRCSVASLWFKLCLPAKTSIEPRVEVSVRQWAAVSTQIGVIIDPPQMWLQPKKQCWMLTRKGNSPGKALTPPKMNGATSEDGAANATAITSAKTMKIFISISSESKFNWIAKFLVSFTGDSDHNLITARLYKIYFWSCIDFDKHFAISVSNRQQRMKIIQTSWRRYVINVQRCRFFKW